MAKRICGVYKITSPSGNFYIGSSRHIKKRFNEHKAALMRGNHCNKILQNAAIKYGVDNFSFEIIEECNFENVRDVEQKYINVLNPKYNLSRNVEKPLITLWESPEFRKRNSEKATAQNKLWWSIPENREKGKDRVLVMLTPEVRLKAKENRDKSLSMRGDVYMRLAEASSKNFKRLHQDPEFSKSHSERMRKLMLERCKDKEYCKKRDLAAAEANKKPIKLLNTGEVFSSKSEAAIAKGISFSLITKQMQGKPTKTGYKWEFVNG